MTPPLRTLAQSIIVLFLIGGAHAGDVVEPPYTNAGFSTPSAFAAAPLATPTGTSLTPPAVINYNGSANTLTVSNTGVGKAILATISNPKNTASALYGQTNGGGAGLTGYNSGTSGPAGKFGVTNAASAQAAVLASTSGTGSAVSATVSATESYSPAVSALNLATDGYGVGVKAWGTYVGVYGNSDYANHAGGYGVRGESNSGSGVAGFDYGSGYGVYGFSSHGYAGYFEGTIAARSFATLSDRNAKTDFKTLDGNDVLSRVSRLPVLSWVFKADPGKHHIGPMAQDFHAAFGLDGRDDTHINLSDLVGVSLAAIQQLNARNAALESQLASQASLIAAQARAIKELRSTTAALRVSLPRS